MINDLIIYFRKYPYLIWQRIDAYISESLPSGDDPEDSQFHSFNLTFYDPHYIDPSDNIFKPLVIENGDDICIATDISNNQILDDVKCGLIYQSTVKPVAYDYDEYRFKNTYTVTVKQRDFSKKVFKINRAVFTDFSISQSLTTILDYIFNNDNTRDDLGGILTNSQVIPKYLLLAENTTIQVFDYEGSTIKNLTEILNSINFQWSIRYYVCPDSINTIKVIQQVIIWQA